MKRIVRILVALAIAGTAGISAVPASATDCSQNPKACSGACHVNVPDGSSIDLRTGTVTLEQPIECYV